MTAGLDQRNAPESVFPRLEPVHFHKCDPGGDGRIDKREYPLLDNFYWPVVMSHRCPRPRSPERGSRPGL